MDNKNFFRALFWALLVFLLWQYVAFRLWGPQKPPAEEGASPAPATATAPATQPAEVAESIAQTPTREQGPELQPVGVDSIETVTLGNISGHRDSPYRMLVELTNVGAAISRLLLSDHRQSVDTDARYQLLAPVPSDDPDSPWHSVSLEKIVVDGREIPLADLKWDVRREESAGSQLAIFTATIVQADQPVLELQRTFRLPAQSAAARRHDLFINLRIRNLTDDSHEVIVTEHGAVGVTREGRFRQDRKLYGATLEEGLIRLRTLQFNDVLNQKKDPTLYERASAEANPLMWWATANLYFTFTRSPVDEQGAPETESIAIVEAVDLDEDETGEVDVTTRTTTVPMSIPPGGQRLLHTAVYAGPKDRKAFQDPANADYIRRDFMGQIKEGYGSCTFNFLTDWMIRLLNWLESVLHNFGVAIFFLVIIVRVLLHPVTKKTQVNMVKMQQSMGSLQPKMEEIKKKYANDNRRIQEETMKLYREEGINPMGQMLGCLPMLLQMPIWVAPLLQPQQQRRHALPGLRLVDRRPDRPGLPDPLRSAAARAVAGVGNRLLQPAAAPGGRDDVRPAETDAQAEEGSDGRRFPAGPTGRADAEDDALHVPAHDHHLL